MNDTLLSMAYLFICYLCVQMQSNTTIKMASILYLTDSAYYPAFKSMYRNVVAALKEAQDITTHLKPLTSHFEVKYSFS